MSMKFLPNPNLVSDKGALNIQKRILAIASALQTIKLERVDLGAESHDTQIEAFLQSRRDAYVAILSPFRRIPPEILAGIFLYIPEEAVTIAQVCRVWRRIAVGIPSLWPRDLLVFLEPRQPGLYPNMVARFLRIAGSPCISACILDRKDAPLPGKVRILLDLSVIPTAVPLKHLYVAPQYVHHLFGDNYLKRKYWNKLEELVIDSSTSRAGSIAGNGPISLTHLTSLIRLTLTVKNRLTVHSICAPWYQLSYLHLDGGLSQVDDYVRIISGCKRIRTLILACHSKVKRRTPLTPRVIIRQLQRVTLIGDDTIAALLSYFELPALTDLRLSARDTPKRTPAYQDSAEDILRLIEASACKIVSLELHRIVLADFEIPDCFHAMPDLAALCVADHGGMGDLLACLRTGYRRAHTPRAPVHLVPKLTTLIVATDHPEHWPTKSFNAMYNHRRTLDIRGAEGCRLTRARLANGIAPFVVYAELSSFVRGLGLKGIVTGASYIVKAKGMEK